MEIKRLIEYFICLKYIGEGELIQEFCLKRDYITILARQLVDF